jgi:hypothetical protein
VEKSGGGDAAAHGPADGVVDGADVVEGAQVGADLMGEARVADHDEAQRPALDLDEVAVLAQRVHEAQRITSQAHEVAEQRQGAGGSFPLRGGQNLPPIIDAP